MKETMLLGEYLMKHNRLTREQLDIALREQAITGQLLGEILICNGFSRRNEVRSALLETNASALMDEDDISVDLKLPREFMKKTRTIVKGDIGNEIIIATLHNNPEHVQDALASLFPHRVVKLSQAPLVEILEKLRSAEDSDSQNKLALAEEEDINKIIDALLNEAAKMRATDIHIEPTDRSVHVRFRIDTVMSHEFTLSLSKYDRLMARIKDRSCMDVAEKRNPQDGSFSFTRRGITIDCRVATVLTAYGEKVAIRLLNKEDVLMDIRSVGITKVEEWLELTKQRNGIILVSGATGSGKSTTLYSTLMSMDRLHRQIYTCEDPVEFRLPYINQCQINYKSDPPFDYPVFSRAILRLNPDIIVYGELRDEETVKHALRSAETGHLVYGTVHNNDAASAISRLIELGATLPQLQQLIRGVLVQRLARKLCKECRGQGCDKCKDGYHGMLPITEFVSFKNGADVQALAEGRLTYHTFTEDAILKVREGLTDCQEISRITAHTIQLCQGGSCVAGHDRCSSDRKAA